MVNHLGKAAGCKSRVVCAAFTLIEVMIAFFIFGLVTGGMIYGYVEANRVAEWSSQSLAAMSYASQGMEQMRAAQWLAEEIATTNGPGTSDVLPLRVQADGSYSYSTNQADTLDIPTSGAPIYATNYITVTQVSTNPPLRQIVSRVVWTFRLSGQTFTNTMVTLRAPDQFQ
ncbi:MAG: prepilin-type N-terminal cleavage/methylation domain-containing protein [Verrucomicrobiota bacterium]|jgi:type II secretory pathway pseudopilin PulG